MKPDLAAVRRRALSILAGFSLGQKVVTALALAGLVLGGVMFTSWSSKPQMVALFTDLDPSDAAAITADLSGRKVAYELADGGRTVKVPTDQVYPLRIDLSSKGLPSGGSQGYALLDKQGITTSEFRQRVDYQRALEGELARTVSAIDGVAGATVHLVIPKDDLFSADSRKPTASVLVKTAPGKTLGSGQVQAVVHLVSSSVEGLNPDDVTVADGKGRVLSAPGEDGAGSAENDARVSKTAGFEEDLAKRLTEMLTTVVGQGKAVVRVKADLDFDQRSSTSERLDPGPGTIPQVVGESSSKETYSGAGTPGAAIGVLGVTATTVPGATTGSGNGAYVKEDAQKSYAYGKVTEQVKAAPGSVKRLSVAVLLDAKSQGASDPATIQKLVSAAAGLDAKRGDTIAVDRLAFDETAAKAATEELSAAEAARSKEQLVDLAKQVGLFLAVATVVLLALRSAKKAAPKRVPSRTALELSDVEAARALLAGRLLDEEIVDADEVVGAPVLVGAGVGGSVEAADEPARALRAQIPKVEREIAQLIERQPEEVAGLLRNWLADRRG